MNVIGISAYYHESACCLLQDGHLVAAVEEERSSRIKHDPALPVASFRYCLAAGGLDITDVDCIAYYEVPARKLARQLWSGRSASHGRWFDPGRPQREIREVLGYEGRIECVEHHHAHAASSFFYSGFDDAAVLTVDGVGEWATTTYAHGTKETLRTLEEVCFPHSLGLFYSTITAYLGFEVNSGEYKVMGLAPYGKPRYIDAMRELVVSRPHGQFELALEYFDFLAGERMHSAALESLLDGPARAAESSVDSFHCDVARSAQLRLEELLLEKVAYLHRRTGSTRLCLAGGVALNCVANGRIAREGPFEDLFVQPAAGDAGGCLGAAALAQVRLSGQPLRRARLGHVYLGPAYPADGIGRLVESAGIPADDYRGRESSLLEAVVDRLEAGSTVGWFHGAMEFGPRALGARSILADPRGADTRDHINLAIKKREAFRPFAPSVLARCQHEHLDLDRASPFMLETCAVRSPLALPAVTHVDGSARPQSVDPTTSPRYAALLEAFYERTGCPMLVNTSFNVRDEPIVCSPIDAIRSFIHSGLDVLVLEDYLIDRQRLPPELVNLAAAQSAVAARQRAISSALYTFI